MIKAGILKLDGQSSQHEAIERTFGWLNRYRRRSKNYELSVESSEAMVQIAMIRLMLRRLERKRLDQQRKLRRQQERAALQKGYALLALTFLDELLDKRNGPGLSLLAASRLALLASFTIAIHSASANRSFIFCFAIRSRKSSLYIIVNNPFTL